MYVIQKHQLDRIEDKLLEAELDNDSLAIDLVDHVCCMIEDKLEAGVPYEEAEDQVFKKFKIAQIKALEYETNFLTQNHIIMKKRTLFTGIMAMIIMIVAFVLELTPIPGGPLLMFVGAFIGIFGFGSQVILDRFSYSKSIKDRIKTVVGFIGTGFFLTGIAFHFTARPFGPGLLIVGGVILLVYFVHDNLYSAKTNISA